MWGKVYQEPAAVLALLPKTERCSNTPQVGFGKFVTFLACICIASVGYVHIQNHPASYSNVSHPVYSNIFLEVLYIF